MSESITQKADRYLTEGRVCVLSVKGSKGEFEVTGSQKYSVTGFPWTCTCPARVLECVHIVACQKITSFDDVKDISFTGDDDASKFMRELLQDL